MNKKQLFFLTVFFIAVVVVMVWWRGRLMSPSPKYTFPLGEIRLGTASQGCCDFSLLISVAEDQGFFLSNGLNVVDKPLATTLEIQQALKSGELDLGVTSDFAYLTAISEIDPLKAKIVANIDKSQRIKIIGRKDRGINVPADLKGKKIAVLKKTSQEYILGTFLSSNDITLEDVQLVDLAPEDAKDAILAGAVDAAVMSGSYVYQVNKSLAENAVIWSARGYIYSNWIVMGSNQFIQDHPEMVEMFLRALVQAEEYVQENPTEAQVLLTRKLNLEQPYLTSIWPESNFSVSLDQSLLLIMENETRWQIANKMTEITEVPNYLDFFYFDALEKVKPEAVNIAH